MESFRRIPRKRNIQSQATLISDAVTRLRKVNRKNEDTTCSEVSVNGSESFRGSSPIDEVLVNYYYQGEEAEESPDDFNSEWNTLEMHDLLRLYFLLSTTHSKSTINLYFQTENVRNELILRRIIFDNTSIIKAVVCTNCAEDIDKCQCGPPISTGEIYFSNIVERFQWMLTVFGREILCTQGKVLRGETTSSPISHPLLKNIVETEKNLGQTVVHFSSGFDGIDIPNTSCKVWPYSLVPLDLSDKTRSTIRSVFLAAVYISHVDPNAKIHDRLTRWSVTNLNQPAKFESVWFTGKIVCGVHDDPARRKIYSLKGHRSKGSCPYCTNQGTCRKMFLGETELRENHLNIISPHLEDGLTERGKSSFFHSICKMWDSPIDVFHCINEGVFDRIIKEVFCETRWHVFASPSASLDGDYLLPSKYKCLNRKLTKATGSEKSHLYETIVVSQAMDGNTFGSMASALILGFHALFRLMVSPEKTNDTQLHQKVSEVCQFLALLIEEFVPDMLGGPKVHQLIYHTPNLVQKYGSLLPFSTQGHEHSYHCLQRHLPTEITKGLGYSILRNTTALQNLYTVFTDRIRNMEDILTTDYHAKVLAEKLKISSKMVVPRCQEAPDNLKKFVGVNEIYVTTHYIEGCKFSTKTTGQSDDSHCMFTYNETVQYGVISGFLLSATNECKVLIQPYVLTDEHVENLGKRLLDDGVSIEIVRKTVAALCDSSYGSIVKSLRDVIVIPAETIVGHAVHVEKDSQSFILPFSFRPMLS